NNGLHSIQLFANDTVGNHYFSELRYFTMETSGPSISILSPSLSQYFGTNPPDFSLNIQGVNLDKRWYSLDGGLTNITFNSNTGTINQIEWDKASHGSVSITFYIYDLFSRWGFTSININKDLNPPTTNIYYTAYSAPNKVISSTTFTLLATDNSESGVSLRRYKVNDGPWQSYIGPFTLASLSLGNYTISYQSVDNVGNVETEKYLEVQLISTPIPPPPPPDLTFIIYIVIGIAIALFGMIYLKVIRPKTADSRARKKEVKMERTRLKSELLEQQSREQERLRQILIEQKRLEREKVIQQQMEQVRFEKERLEQIRIMKELEKQSQAELIKKQRLEEEHAIIEKIRKVMNVSTRVKMDTLKDYLKMDTTTFNQKIFDWAAQFNFTIDGDYLNIRKENVSDFIDELEKQFSSWRRTEENQLDKL
ncbi:MAG: hypothetical protein EAX89_12120, partial [Candidatus Lokiarchaeota archaeon]|nr:hypothetical protein [Candidatus Lokiarchaeota archaeon]